MHSRSTATTRVCNASRTIRVSSRILLPTAFVSLAKLASFSPSCNMSSAERLGCGAEGFRPPLKLGHRTWFAGDENGIPPGVKPLIPCINPTPIHPIPPSPPCSNIHEDAISVSSNESDHSSLADLTHQACVDAVLSHETPQLAHALGVTTETINLFRVGEIL